MATVASGSKIFFAGGSPDASGGNPSSVVDIYDVVSNTWSIAALSEAGYKIVAAAVGDKVLFAGGTGLGYRSINVDIYNIQTKSWSTTNLPLARASGHSAVSANGKVYIAGGNGLYNGSVDIYDNATTSWSTWTMSEAKADFAGIALGSKIYWAGGEVSYLFCGGLCGNLGGGTYSSCQVEIRDGSTGASSYQQISSPATWRNYNGQNAVEKDGKIIFLGKSSFPNYFDIYDTATNSWSVGLLPQGIEKASIISVNNVIYVAGGEVNNVLSGQVSKLELQTVLPHTLLNFSAEVVQKDVKIKWQIANEINIKNYIVQRSRNGSDFYDIGNVKSNNTTSTNAYSFLDINPHETINFYRLRIENNDGRFTYSNILTVKLNTINNAISIYPNPAKNNTSILFNSGTKDHFNIQITDVAGRLMKYTEGVSGIGANSISIDLTGFAPGVYSINFNSQHLKQSVKFYKE
jgi:hypothetical protein